MSLLRPELRRRPVHGALSIDGVAAVGPAVRGLVARLLLEGDEVLGLLRGVAGPHVAVVHGPTEHLPWFEGAIYLQRVEDAPSLWLPTGVPAHPSGPALLRALRTRAPKAGLPLVALPGMRRLVSLAEARPLDRQRLRDQLGSS